MQQTVSAEGFSGQAFSTFVPHTVRANETKHCTDCHVSASKDNNAWMAKVLLQGTNFVNFIGRYVWVATGEGGLEAVAVAERDEPPAIYRQPPAQARLSSDFQAFVSGGQASARGRSPSAATCSMCKSAANTLRGARRGRIPRLRHRNIDNKDFCERIVTAPVSPLGQRLYVKTRYAVAVATPTTLGVDPVRTRKPENEEQTIHPMYGYLYVTDRKKVSFSWAPPRCSTATRQTIS